MLPLIVGDELRNAVQAFLRSAFPIATRFFQRTEGSKGAAQALLDRFLNQPGGLFKGPYLDIRLPFRAAGDGGQPFQHIKLAFHPYQHQAAAFARLCGESPRSTLVATGTGSGKTECFLLPALDDCLARRKRGIKTIVVYPMNALATDQARRFAAEVQHIKREHGVQLSVGLFVGGEQKNATTSMGPAEVITSHEALRQNPPDILLTNYKMLDFLLIRPGDQALWRFNEPGTLRYLVVDELHTFDGAQGTDLACLIRRLRDRLQAGQELACVGTSATLGADAGDVLREYASKVFAAEFDADAVIQEDRLSATEYLQAADPGLMGAGSFPWPDASEPELDPARHASSAAYVHTQSMLWFADLPAETQRELSGLLTDDEGRRLRAAMLLGELLHRHPAFHALVHATGQLVDVDRLAREWQQRLGLREPEHAHRLLASLLSLVAAARLPPANSTGDDVVHGDAGITPSSPARPFLEVRAQLWLRELRRMVCSVPGEGELPQIAYADDLVEAQHKEQRYLPLLHCRDCHMAAWGALAKYDDPQNLDGSLQAFYQHWFARSPQARLLVPLAEGDIAVDRLVQHLCPACLRLQMQGQEGRCRHCKHGGLQRVWVPDLVQRSAGDGPPRRRRNCPECNARDSLFIVGYRAASLTSVLAGRLFATPYNDDHKLIAFSDSVQDAAHRAGFLGSNTWRQVVRQALTGWLRQQAGPCSLADMASALPAWWRGRLADDAEYCGLFTAPDMRWLRDYQALTERGRLPAGSDLPQDVHRRLAWECVAEFGRRSRIGRSLERTGTAAVGLDAERLRADVAALAARLREEVEGLRTLPDERFVQFVLGWFLHMRQEGAIYHPMLDEYLRRKGDEYILNVLTRWMPNFGRSRRPPSAMTLGHVAANFEAIVLSSRATWSQQWLNKLLAHEQVLVSAEARHIYTLCTSMLARQGWLVERDAGGEMLYMLDPHRLQVSAASARAVCDGCGHSVWVPREDAALYENLPCTRARCQGHLSRPAAVVASGSYAVDLPRPLVAHEHTGLLSRDERERVERSFMQGQHSWDVNLLSATPTLEMGIDIGALSTVFLCSVPPTQANYLQRIGRAGRRDGNALAVTIAGGQRHDLYFYADPMEMMAGAVDTPGVFLDATAVLERQLMAYCMDRWVAGGVDPGAIPARLRPVLDNVENRRQGRFPYNLINFVQQQEESLLDSFFALFPQLGPAARDYLRSYLRGTESESGSLAWRLLDRLQGLVNVRTELQRQVRQLRHKREQLLAQPQDEATSALVEGVVRERRALLALLASRNRQQVLNFLTDEGLLPNYAFPEEGVTLQSVILRHRVREQNDEGQPREKLTLSFQRPAQAALSELAPENRFYAAGHAMPIDRIDLGLSRDESWRFCDACHYSERVDEVGDRHSACPRCGSAQWADSSQKHTVLKLRQVYSTVDNRRDRIGDDSEQRQPQFFNRQMLVDVAPEDEQGGWRLRDPRLPFGFEFLSRVTLREVNFGTAGVSDAKSFKVAGRELPRSGFRVCRHCGTVQKVRPRRGEIQHAYTCKLRTNPSAASEEDFFGSLYLYRELQSEALRILLPLSEVAYSEVRLQSFVAALNLGLREYFRGNVQHLQLTEMRQPAPGGGSEHVYLVVYDRIPGGTGYLKDLMQSPEHMMRVLELAHHRLTHCSCCEDEERDGCYRCILAYRNSRDMGMISRRSAAELLGQILVRRDAVERVDSLRSIDTGALTQSVLEQRFLDALDRIPDARLVRSVINGKPARVLTLPGPDNQTLVAWRVEQQVRVGPADGVAVPTEIDVLLTPMRDRDAQRQRPIAVYLDGLQYHHDIVAEDVIKRSALLLSGGYWVWSLNWDDVPTPDAEVRPQAHDLMTLPARYPDLEQMFKDLAASAAWLFPAEQRARSGWGSYERLVRWLRDPDATTQEYWQRACLRAFTALAPERAADAVWREELSAKLAGLTPTLLHERLAISDSSRIPGGLCPELGNASPCADLYLAVPQKAVQSESLSEIANGIAMLLCFDDRETEASSQYKDRWRGFWHAANQLQFLPGFAMGTQTAADSEQLDRLWAGWRALSEVAPAAGTAPQGWDGVFEFSTLEADQIHGLMKLDLPEPEVGVDLLGPDGSVALGGEVVELVWADQRVAIVHDPAATLGGWRLVVADENMLPTMRTLLTEGMFP